MDLTEVEDYSIETVETEESSSRRAIFDKNKFEQVKDEGFSLTESKIFKNSLVKNLLKRHKEEYVVVSKKEHILDCKYAKGKAYIPLISKELLQEELRQIKTKDTMRYVYLAATEILVKACFREGIDTPIELYIADDRIKHPIEKSIVGSVKGNLTYQVARFIIKSNYSIALCDSNISKSFVLYWKISGIEMEPGSKIVSVKAKNMYVFSNKHYISAKEKIADNIVIDKKFEDIIRVIDYDDKGYSSIDDKQLSIIQERLTNVTLNQEETSQFRILGILRGQVIPILIDTGAVDNYITPNLVQTIVRSSSHRYGDFQGNIFNSIGNVEETFNISNRDIPVKLEIQSQRKNSDKEVIFGTKFLNQVKPYSIEFDQLKITWKNEVIIVPRDR